MSPIFSKSELNLVWGSIYTQKNHGGYFYYIMFIGEYLTKWCFIITFVENITMKDRFNSNDFILQGVTFIVVMIILYYRNRN